MMKATVATATIGIIISKWGFGICCEKRYAQTDKRKAKHAPPVRLQLVNRTPPVYIQREINLLSKQIHSVCGALLCARHLLLMQSLTPPAKQTKQPFAS